MATADRQMWTGRVTIASTSYTAVTAPSLDGTIYIGAGCWSINNPGTVDVIVSEDGTNDAFTVCAGTAYTVPISTVNGKIWIRLQAAGSVIVTGNLTARSKMEF